jgi:hypothetical protein
VAEVTVEVREFLTCAVCGYRKMHRRDDPMLEMMVKGPMGMNCEGACAYKGEAHWRASRLQWTDTIRCRREAALPVATFEIETGTITYGDGRTLDLSGTKISFG